MIIPEGIAVVAEFETFAVVEKPSGLLSVPGRTPENQDCVSERFKVRFPDAISHPSVHRLDWETSGLMVLARTKEAHRRLSIQFSDRVVDKRYIAVLDGVVADDSGVVELPFRLDVDNRPYQIYDEVYGKIGVTHWKKLAVENGQTRIEFTPLTGRTHQLRLHSSHPKGLGFPIVGDCLYGTGTAVNQLKLHAAHLSFNHPETGERLTYDSVPRF